MLPTDRGASSVGVCCWHCPGRSGLQHSLNTRLMQAQDYLWRYTWCKSRFLRRWPQPAQPALPYEEDDDDETEGLSALSN